MTMENVPLTPAGRPDEEKIEERDLKKLPEKTTAALLRIKALLAEKKSAENKKVDTALNSFKFSASAIADARAHELRNKVRTKEDE